MTPSHQPPLTEKVAFLRDPRSYPGGVRRVTAIETHFAWVFLTSEHAHKLKKPMRHGAMDYRSLAAREHGCREELRLNRRFAPAVYRSVIPLVRRDGRLALGGDGEIVDWLVRMRRLPDARMLDCVLARRTLRGGELDRLVRALARFFRAARPEPMRGAAYVSRLDRQVAQNRRALRRAGARARQRRADSVARAQRRFLRRARRLLGERAAHVVEGHGDLRAEHVCLAAPVTVIDRLEFSHDLRRVDPLEEVAFLSLEIERLGHRELAAELVRRFCEATRDPASPALVCFYRSHRAANRAKLAAWHLGDPQFPDPRPWLARTDSYLRDAGRHALEALRLVEAGSSVPVDGRPALEQRRNRRPPRHAADEAAEQRRHRNDRQASGR
jgi:aminoglycoside phosphotransferase family enzyme